MRPSQLPALPSTYYLGHFEEMLAFVQRVYGHLLNRDETGFIDDFLSLSQDGRCLYVRLANRKHRILHRQALDYAEIGDIVGAWQELSKGQFMLPLEPQDEAEALASLPKQDLLRLLGAALPGDALRPSWSRRKLADYAIGRGSELFQTPWEREDFAVQGRLEALGFLQFLYFGRLENNLQKFTLRDLGIYRTRQSNAVAARFADRQAAEQAYFYHRRRDELPLLSGDKLWQWYADLPEWPASAGDALRNQVLESLGQGLEKAGAVEEALAVYGHGDSASISERQLRLLYRHDKDAARQRLENIIDAPASAEEAAFAEDFYARKFAGKRTSELTDALRQAPIIRLDESFKGNVEYGAQCHYRQQGLEAYYSENTLWRSLFGLLFWDSLFGDEGAGLGNEFDRLPPALCDGSFSHRCRQAIEAGLNLLDEPEACVHRLLQTVASHYGSPNGLFQWQPHYAQRLVTLVRRAPRGSLRKVMAVMADDFKHNSDGFPDLLLYQEGLPRLVEIKSEGDSLRRNQWLRLGLLREAGFQADIVRVEWAYDPQQDYVVVDLETTGGQARGHRVTEIGAVRVRNAQIVDEWHSLIYPERLIPLNITRLTGISNDMVADAPIFAEVADQLRAFLGEAVFVAHNVNFDYGFLQAEFARLEQDFRLPKVCTCAGMRRYFPGRRSYSLKALCGEFDIDQGRHHRALDDARAAAQLLIRMNRFRQQQENQPQRFNRPAGRNAK